ncbi:MAG TPA: hypothetical protein VH186_22840 [Chloroflexia bacterium]|nr:hypothetical protein [Chloroflexia bacterium]
MTRLYSYRAYKSVLAVFLLLSVLLSACGDATSTPAVPAGGTSGAGPSSPLPATATPTSKPVSASVATPTRSSLPTVTSLAATPSPKPVATGPGKLVYESAEPLHVIYAVNPDGTAKTKIADGMSPVLSPDGKRVAYVKITAGQFGIRPFDSVVEVANLDGSGKQELCKLKQNYVVSLLRWSPRDRFIAYREAPSNTDGIPQIGLCNTADKQTGEVIRNQAKTVMLYDWSPDGENAIWLVGPDFDRLKLYYGDPDKGGQGAVEIAAGLHRIPDGPFSTGYNTARFSPDGKTIAVSGSKLFFVSVPGQKSPLDGRTIDLGSSASVVNIAFSPDGKTLAVVLFSTAGYPYMKLVDLGDKQFGKISEIPDGPYRAISLDWSRQ